MSLIYSDDAFIEQNASIFLFFCEALTIIPPQNVLSIFFIGHLTSSILVERI